MNLIIIEEKLNKLDVDNYLQIMNEVISEIMNYINNNDSEIVTYYELLNFTGLNIPCYAKSYILSTLFNKSEKLRKICFSQALSEIKESLYKTFGIIDETLAQSLRNSILGENFILEGYDNSSWDEAINLLNDLNQKKIMQSKEPEKIVFWSKIKDHTFLNNEFITIENSTLGSSMFFLDLVYNNWSSDCIESPKLEEFILPTIDIYKKKSNRKVYVATYKDKIIILDNTLSIENVYNLSNYKHNGLVGTEGKYLLWQDKLDDIKSGIIYSFLTEKVIVNKILQSIEDEIEDNIIDEELKKLIENSNNEENVDDVISKLARLKYESLSDDEKSKLYKKVVDNNMKFVLSVENGLINVSLLNGDESYQGERKVLYDSNNLGIYNELIDILKKEKIDYTNDIDSIVYEVNGNIITRSEYLYNQQSNKKQHIEVIESLEKLLNISITPILSLKLDSNTNMPTPIYKDTNMLQEECRIILVGLDQLYNSNKIDYEMYMMFKNEVRLEYTNYINMVDSIDNNINNTVKK